MDQLTGHGVSLQYVADRPSVPLFGRFQLNLADGSEFAIPNRRGRALLAMLCLARDEALDREFLSMALWEGRFPAHAKASLRQCLLDTSRLLDRLGKDMLDVTRTSVALPQQSIVTDLDALEDAFARRDFPAATDRLATIGSKPILDQMNFGASFDSWRERQGVVVERRLRQAVEGALETLAHDGDSESRDRLADVWSWRASTGDPSRPSRDRDGRTRIAVLPFQSFNPSADLDYFSDGIADELITALSQVPQLVVAGRTSSFQFRNSDLASPSVAEALRVAHLIEGSVQRQGDQVRIFVRLTDGADGFESWGQRFDGALDDIFALQEKVAQAVTAALSRQLGLVMIEPSVSTSTSSKVAYDLYLQGKALNGKVFGDGVLDRAIRFLEEALAIDPSFAEAWLELAETYHQVAVYTQRLDRNAAAEQMAICARKVIALAPQLGYSYSLLGMYEISRGNMVGALDLVFEGFRQQPSHPGVTMRLASFLLYCGRTGDAEPYVLAALDQDPADGRKYGVLWSLRFGQGDLHAALAAAQRLVDLGWPSMYLAITSAALGRNAIAIEQYQQTKRLVNTFIVPPAGSPVLSDEAMDAYWHTAAKGICSGVEEDRLIYGQVLEMMYATVADPGDFAIAGAAIFCGNAEVAFKAMCKSRSPVKMVAFLALWADVDPIRRVWQHPGFLDFAERIGLVAAWEKYGWPDLLIRDKSLN